MLQFTLDKLKRAETLVLLTALLFAGMMAAGAIFAGVGEVWEQLMMLDMVVWAVLLGCALINYFLRGIRWDFFGRALNIRLSFGRVMLYYMSGFALAATPGKIGTALRLYLLKKGHGHDMIKTTPMYILDQFTDLIAIFALAVLGTQAVGGHDLSLFIIFMLAVGFTLLVWKPIIIEKLLLWLDGLLKNKYHGLIEKLVGLLHSTRNLLHAKTLLPTTALSFVGWAAEVYALWFLLDYWGVEISLLGASFVFTFATLVGALTLLPGGIGGNEITAVGLLILLGVPSDIAVAAWALIRLTTLWFGVGLGFLVLPFGLKSAERAGKSLQKQTTVIPRLTRES